MKKRYIVLICLLFISIASRSQSYGFDVELKNFDQVDESTIEWDVYIKKSSGTNDFALWQMQVRHEFNNDIFNSGEFTSDSFTIKEVGENMNQNATFFQDIDCTVLGSFPNRELNWAVSSPPANGQSMTIVSDTWLKVARFSAKLEKNGNLHNFASVDPEFAFQSSGTQIIIRRANNTSSIYDNSGSVSIPLNNASPDLGVSINEHQLASHCFTGDGLWSETSRWNNVTSENANTLPGDHDNALIKGNVTIDDSRSLTASGGNGGQVTVLTGPPPPTYTLTLETNAGTFSSEQIVGGEYDGEDSGEFTEGSEVTIQTSSLVLSSVEWTSNAGGSFEDYQAQQTVFTMPGNDVTVTANWSAKKLNEKPTSNNIDKKQSNSNRNIYSSLTIAHSGSLTVDKLFNENENGADAVVIESNSSGTGSLIITESVIGEITAQRYLGDGAWHYIAPMTDNVTAADFFWNYEPTSWLAMYDEPTGQWNYNESLSTPMPLGSGCSVWLDPEAKSTATAVMTGNAHAADLDVTLTDNPGLGDGFNFIGNPYTSAIDVDLVGDISGTTGAVYIWDNDIDADGGYRQYSGGGGNLTDGIIPVGQGFFIQADGNGTFTIPASARVHASSDIYKNANGVSESELPYVKLELKHQDYLNTVFVGFPDYGTEEFDMPGDATKLYDNAESPQFFVIENGHELSINTRSPIESGTQSVPLHLVQVLDGSYSIELFQRESLADLDILLEDLKTGETHDFDMDGLVYSFEGLSGDEEDRFLLHFNKASTIGMDEYETGSKYMDVYAYKNQLHIISEGSLAEETGMIRIFDSFGRLLMIDDLAASSKVTYNLQYATKLIVVEVVKPSGVTTEKIIIE